MRLSTKSRYGTRAILEIAKSYGQKPIKRKEIVSGQKIPDSYLENILITLKAAGFIRTLRGANGGYQLTRDPKLITILEIANALEGHMTPVPCLDTDKCDLIQECATRSVWSEMYQAMEKVLRSYTLQDIIEKNNETDPIDYFI
ncbi:MAG: RrF2 family transcriptional regulator [Bacteroidetes bacterium]|nr:RrF2 family transcriptional regulator [Bacteroidota bacterium]